MLVEVLCARIMSLILRASCTIDCISSGSHFRSSLLIPYWNLRAIFSTKSHLRSTRVKVISFNNHFTSYLALSIALNSISAIKHHSTLLGHHWMLESEIPVSQLRSTLAHTMVTLLIKVILVFWLQPLHYIEPWLDFRSNLVLLRKPRSTRNSRVLGHLS